MIYVGVSLLFVVRLQMDFSLQLNQEHKKPKEQQTKTAIFLKSSFNIMSLAIPSKNPSHFLCTSEKLFHESTSCSRRVFFQKSKNKFCNNVLYSGLTGPTCQSFAIKYHSYSNKNRSLISPLNRFFSSAIAPDAVDNNLKSNHAPRCSRLFPNPHGNFVYELCNKVGVLFSLLPIAFPTIPIYLPINT